jgi:hypothetical protein
MFTPGAIRSYLSLLILSLVIILLVTGLYRFYPSLYSHKDAVALTGGFTLAAFISLLIFFNGFSSEAGRSVFLTLMALGMKLLLSLVLALLFLVVFKNDQTGSVILFFIIYLAFTFYVIHTFVSVLKKKKV